MSSTLWWTPPGWRCRTSYAKDAGLIGLIGAIAFLLCAIWLLLFAARKCSWVWPSPYAQSCKKELKVANPSYAATILARR